MFVKKQDRSQGLRLCCRGHMAVDGEVTEKCFDLRASKLSWMAPAVENHEAPYPPDILLFSSKTVVTHAKRLAHLIEEARFSGHAV